MRTLKHLVSLSINYFFLNVPSHALRIFYLKRILGEFGAGSTLLRGCEIRNPGNIFIGHNTVINQNVLMDGRGGNIIIGNNVDIAQETCLWTLQHDVHDDFHKTKGGDVVVEDYVWIASRVTVLPGRKIKYGAVVGSCSLVTKDVESRTIVGGNPAKYLGNRRSKLQYNLFYRPKFK